MERRVPTRPAVVLLSALILVAGGMGAFGPLDVAAAPPSVPFQQCPHIGLGSGCGLLIVINPDRSVSVFRDPAQPPFDGSDDTLIGVVNGGLTTVSTLPVSSASSTPIFNFDGDGLCAPQTPNRPPGCPFGDTGYEGPGTSFRPADPNNGTVIFGNGGLRPGASTYFSLEAALTASSILIPRYVALGDSYSSGEGVPPFSGGDCHRSAGAYPELILHRPGVPSAVEFWACSGAVISDFYHVQRGAQETQLARLGPAGGDATLVTLGVGGNDIGFKTVAETCTKATILIFQRNSAFKENCRNVLDGNGAESKRIDNLMTGINEPPDNQPYSLPQLYRDTRARAPGGRVYAVGYPRILPASLSQDCGGQIKRENGSGVTFGPFHADFSIAKQDAEWMNKLIAHLNSVIGLAALNAGFYYVDTQDAFSSHDICGQQPWAHGPTLQNSNDNTSSFSYHPNVKGQAAMADRVARKISSSDSTVVVYSQQSVTQTIPVAPGLMELGVQSSWFGSDVEMSLVSPSGKVYDRRTQAGVIHHLQRNGESFALTNPEPGQWTVRLFGAKVPPVGEPVRLDVTQVPRTALAPIAVIDASRDRGVAPKTIQFDSHSSSAFGGATIKNYQWSFGDGTAPGSGSTASHVFHTVGLHTVSLTVTDSAGLSDTAHQDVFVSATNQPPSAQFVWGQPDPTRPRAVLMDASSSSDVDGNVVAYSWDFGDGSNGTGVAPSHSYSQPGKYPVILTVTDDGGLQGSTCQLVTAGSPIPSSPEPCNAPGLPKSGSSFSAGAGGVASNSTHDPIPLPLATVVVAMGDRLRRAIVKRNRARASIH